MQVLLHEAAGVGVRGSHVNWPALDIQTNASLTSLTRQGRTRHHPRIQGRFRIWNMRSQCLTPIYQGQPGCRQGLRRNSFSCTHWQSWARDTE